jgi:hypothetical protein
MAGSPQLQFRQFAGLGGSFMATTEPIPTGSSEGVERIPIMQRILDNPFLLLFLGVTIPTVLYILWGVMEIASIPLAK